jgi:hypothetical protein
MPRLVAWALVAWALIGAKRNVGAGNNLAAVQNTLVAADA